MSVSIYPYSYQTNTVTFTLSDSGIGIAPEKLDKIFDPFVQADASTTRKFCGTGLGLAIVKQFVVKMGGELTVKSEENKGIRYKFNMVVLKLSTC
ncbi:ATP-binding protein [Vibrio sp. ZSDZ34]|uniref:histidine kinase n=1 Tax=Vibrio gelatinilyticus TaxID=2893468 RepID=A0A9X2AYM4_9VIBR|nr:ATP-binding protein [Vibrio gelatinilyticus]